ncbi:MAG: nucleotide exchange factor GrpE [Alphaproteobacteria bacterium]|nr:nucleotide exchange factor GrpE [Alphaproteobacteria bacterium]
MMSNEAKKEENANDMNPESAAEMPQASASQTPAEAPQDDVQKMREQMLRAMAEAENTRKRMDRERDDIRKYAIVPFARDMLAVSDNLHRALEAVPAELRDSDPRVQSLLQGLQAVENELQKIFERHKIKRLYPLGEMFDPNQHEVMFETPGTGKPSGTVTLVVEAGYMLFDRLIRPARVGIAKDADSSGPSPAHSGGTVDTQA